jgi:hypothetical protein
MMGLCNSCFGKKYLGRSPPEGDCYLDVDAEKLITSASPKISVFSSSGGNNEANKIEKLLEKSEASDSGTCIDEFCDKRGGGADADCKEVEPSPPPPTANGSHDEDEEEKEVKEDADEDSSSFAAAKENGTCYSLELENVQVTLSSVGSLGGILEEAAEHDGDEDEGGGGGPLQPLLPPQQDEAPASLASTTAEEDVPLLAEAAQRRSATPTLSVSSGGLKPASEDRHHSFGSKKSILASVMAEGDTI